jgi:hypothetical protein
MPLFMDVHNMDGGVSCDAVRDAHAKDVAIQGDHDVNYKSYCLVEAPDAETATRVHREAHGLEADEIYEVTEGS